jgi:hypothetical protein
VQKFVGGVGGHKLACFHQCDSSSECQGFAQVVGHEDDGFFQPLLQGEEVALLLGAGDGIERAERLVLHEK